MLNFGILGPVEARHGDRRLALGGPRPRALLAILLLKANQVVPIGQLVEMLWGDRPPSEGKSTVQGYVCRLRRVFGHAVRGGGNQHRVITRAPGYVLAVDPQELDLLRFEQLVARARRAGEAGRYQPVVDILDEALALWRGPAMADVAADTGLAAAAHRLEESRLAATEQKVAAELVLGRHELVVGQLRDLMDAWPTREGFVEQLMTALYRCDRRAEALDAYRRARHQLVARLGVEPGPSLQQLEQRILCADPSLHHPGHPSGGSRGARVDLSGVPRPRRRVGGTAPRQLPCDIATFVGRDAELDRLQAVLSAEITDTPLVCAVNGVAGVGKSTLAIRVAHRVAHRFPDGQLYVDLQDGDPRRPPPATRNVLGRLIRALGPPSRPVCPDIDITEATATYRSLLADRQVLIVLDGAGSAAQVRPLLPGSAASTVLITSRRMLGDLDTAQHLHLDVLSRHAITLLAVLIGHRRIHAEPAAAALIARCCDYLPLAVRIIGTRLADRPGWSLTEVAAHLADEHTRLDMLRCGELSVAAGIRASYDALCAEGGITAPAPRAFRLLGLLDGVGSGAGIGIGLVAALLDQPPATALRALETLADLRLLHAAEFGRYRMANLVRLVARQCAAEHEPDTERVVAALDRAAGAESAGSCRSPARRPAPLSQL